MTRTIIALDIGTGERGSGYVCFDTSADEHHPVSAENTMIMWPKMESNEEILDLIRCGTSEDRHIQYVFEGISSYGKGIGQSTMTTLLWIGQMIGTIETRREFGDPPPEIVLRRTVAAHLVGSRRKGDPSMDSMIAAAVRERFGGMGATRSQVCGTKKNPGPLYGFTKDIWQAMACGIAYVEGAAVEKEWRR